MVGVAQMRHGGFTNAGPSWVRLGGAGRAFPPISSSSPMVSSSAPSTVGVTPLVVLALWYDFCSCAADGRAW